MHAEYQGVPPRISRGYIVGPVCDSYLLSRDGRNLLKARLLPLAVKFNLSVVWRKRVVEDEQVRTTKTSTRPTRKEVPLA